MSASLAVYLFVTEVFFFFFGAESNDADGDESCDEGSKATPEELDAADGDRHHVRPLLVPADTTQPPGRHELLHLHVQEFPAGLRRGAFSRDDLCLPEPGGVRLVQCQLPEGVLAYCVFLARRGSHDAGRREAPVDVRRWRGC